MPEPLSVTVYVTREVVREVEVEVNPVEFAAWSSGWPMTPESLQEFIQSDRDFSVETLWADGDEIDVEPGGSIEVQKVPQ